VTGICSSKKQIETNIEEGVRDLGSGDRDKGSGSTGICSSKKQIETNIEEGVRGQTSRIRLDGYLFLEKRIETNIGEVDQAYQSGSGEGG
jgi:hypothetical protein